MPTKYCTLWFRDMHLTECNQSSEQWQRRHVRRHAHEFCVRGQDTHYIWCGRAVWRKWHVKSHGHRHDHARQAHSANKHAAKTKTRTNAQTPRGNPRTSANMNPTIPTTVMHTGECGWCGERKHFRRIVPNDIATEPTGVKHVVNKCQMLVGTPTKPLHDVHNTASSAGWMPITTNSTTEDHTLTS